jgi:hypothetical protein
MDDDMKLFKIACRVWIFATSQEDAEQRLHDELKDVVDGDTLLAVESYEAVEVTGEK